MQMEYATTPFGGRRISFAQIQALAASKNIQTDKAIDKWFLYKELCVAKASFGVNDRSLAVLSALLSFYPDNTLGADKKLVVFPSNRQLSLRAHGMPDTTLRRHLASLVTAGLVSRRDSPNGKRYAYKDRAGEVEEAFGFSLAPMLARADEILAAADRLRTEAVLLKRTRERITLQRRDISKLIETALNETLDGDWNAVFDRFRTIVDAIPRRATLNQLQIILRTFDALRSEIDNMLISKNNTEKMNGNDNQNGRQHNESNPESHFESQTAINSTSSRSTVDQEFIQSVKSYPLELVLKTCPDITDYATSQINDWRDLVSAATRIRQFLEINTSAYQEALGSLGHENTAAAIAYILQHNQNIQSAGAYLRALSRKAKAGELCMVSLFMTGLKTQACNRSDT